MCNGTLVSVQRHDWFNVFPSSADGWLFEERGGVCVRTTAIFGVTDFSHKLLFQILKVERLLRYNVSGVYGSGFDSELQCKCYRA